MLHLNIIEKSGGKITAQQQKDFCKKKAFASSVVIQKSMQTFAQYANYSFPTYSHFWLKRLIRKQLNM